MTACSEGLIRFSPWLLGLQARLHGGVAIMMKALRVLIVSQLFPRAQQNDPCALSGAENSRFSPLAGVKSHQLMSNLGVNSPRRPGCLALLATFVMRVSVLPCSSEVGRHGAILSIGDVAETDCFSAHSCALPPQFVHFAAISRRSPPKRSGTDSGNKSGIAPTLHISAEAIMACRKSVFGVTLHGKHIVSGRSA